MISVAMFVAATSFAAWQQPAADLFSGEYKSSEIQLKLDRAGAAGTYHGSILFQGTSMPLTARAVGASALEGSFQADGNAFPFELRKEGSQMVLLTGGATYRLESTRSAGIVGAWQNDKGIMRFHADGSGVALGEEFRYQISGGTNLTLTSPRTNVTLQFSVSGNVLTLRGPQGEMTLSRVDESAASATSSATPQELAGKYCYMANVNATNGGARSSNQCITLHPDGRYEYYGLTDSYNPNGGATSQTSDRGTWSATATTLSGKSSVTGKVATYRLEKRNHPKTNDPMIVLDGQAFVTAYQKPPWR